MQAENFRFCYLFTEILEGALTAVAAIARP
jgi:hypothetical protein